MHISTHERRVLTEANSFWLIVGRSGLLTPCQNTLTHQPRSRGREDRRSRGRATDTQRHGRGAEDAAGGTEGLRRGRASPTPTGCTQSHPERPQGHRSGTRCRRLCGATLSPSRAHSPTRRATGQDRRHRVRSIHPSHAMPTGGAQMPHRGRSGARGTATHPQRQDEPQPPRVSRRGYEVHLFEYGDGAQPQSRKAARRKG